MHFIRTLFPSFFIFCWSPKNFHVEEEEKNSDFFLSFSFVPLTRCSGSQGTRSNPESLADFIFIILFTLHIATEILSSNGYLLSFLGPIFVINFNHSVLCSSEFLFPFLFLRNKRMGSEGERTVIRIESFQERLRKRFKLGVTRVDQVIFYLFSEKFTNIIGANEWAKWLE